MKNFDASFQQNDPSPLRVSAKKGQNLNMARYENQHDFGNATTIVHNLHEFFHQILRGCARWFGVLQHLLDRWTLGAYSRSPQITWIILIISGIIMFRLLGANVAKSENTATFAETNAKEHEKTNTGRGKQKRSNTPAITTSPAATNKSVSYDLSPASVKDLRAPDVKSYIDRFSKVAVEEMDKFGIPASISMAQAIVESRSGTSALAVHNNNHFGIKCFSKACPQGHCSNFKDDHHKDFFIKYKGPWESWRAHSNFLMKHSYRRLVKSGKNYKAWARGLRELGYATDPSYDSKLIGIIERYELYKLDDL
jgi:flagellum-specific peptidoglycan hydrolase FlgJ